MSGEVQSFGLKARDEPEELGPGGQAQTDRINHLEFLKPVFVKCDPTKTKRSLASKNETVD